MKTAFTDKRHAMLAALFSELIANKFTSETSGVLEEKGEFQVNGCRITTEDMVIRASAKFHPHAIVVTICNQNGGLSAKHANAILSKHPQIYQKTASGALELQLDPNHINFVHLTADLLTTSFATAISV